MNVFGIGGWELVLVLLIMLIVAGPKRMAQWAYTLGTWTAKLRVMWEEVAESLQKELDESGVNVEVPRTPPTRQSIQRSIEQYGKDLMESAGNPQDELKKIGDDLKGVGQQVKGEVDGLDRDVRSSTKVPAKQNGAKQPVKAGETAPDNTQNSAQDTSSNPDSGSENNADFGTWGGQ